MRNVPLLEATMQHITSNPDEHYQGWWFEETDCGTVACFAGWACILSGYRPFLRDVESPAVKARVVYRGTLWPVAGVAQDLLGLTHQESNVVFDGGNTRSMLELMVKDLVNGDQLRSREEYQDEVA